MIPQKNIDSTNPTENCVADHIPFNRVEKIPVFPGCIGSDNNILKECFSSSISNFIINNFDLKHEFTENYGDGTIRMFTRFIITKDGQITDIKVRALNTSLERELIKVIEKLPQMIPGKQKGKNINVLYTFPIIFDM